ncbi:MAG: ABC transporter substrate-binding protein [Bdellovibrionales bacterium]|nr:ABC transporter substrate-binding protein [Bdellovibrionales bacterium]
MKKWWILLAAVGLSAQMTFAATKTFVYCSEGSPSIFNPQLATDGPTFNASSRPIYNRLVDFENGSTKVVPSLATKWEVNKQGTSFTFHLRKGVKFHSNAGFTPTRDFNADDVLFTFNRMLDAKHPYHKVNGGAYEYFRSMDMDKIIKKVEKIDDLTVRFELTRPEAPFLANLGMDFASITSAEYGLHLSKISQKEKFDYEPIGTGPFQFKKYVKDSLIRYSANEKYFLGKPKLDQLIYSITVDPTVRYQKLRTGECHFIAEPAPTDIAAMKKNKQIKVMEQEGLNVGYIALNVEKKPLDNVKVRQAINHALNKDSYIKAIYLGNAVVAKNPIPPIMWSYNQDVKPYSYDLAKAKQLLKEAGYPNGFEIELWTLPISRPYNPNGKKMGELVQADLKKIGIKVSLKTYKWATYLEKSRKGEHQMIELGWTGDNGDPDNFLNVLLGCQAVNSGSNLARWCNKEFDHLVGRAKVTTDVIHRTKFYLKAQKVFKEKAPWVPVAHALVYKAMSSKVTGYTPSPFGTESFYEVDIQ